MARTSISRRIEKTILAFKKNGYEDAFIQLFPAIDKTAKKRRHKDGVGSRIRNFISDEEAIITAIATGNIIRINIDGIDFPTALYKFGRTSIVHEGELNERLQINNTGSLEIGKVWNLPSSYIIGLIVSVIIAPENISERIEQNIGINILGKEFFVNELWGQKKTIQEYLCNVFRDENLFKKST